MYYFDMFAQRCEINYAGENKNVKVLSHIVFALKIKIFIKAKRDSFRDKRTQIDDSCIAMSGSSEQSFLPKAGVIFFRFKGDFCLFFNSNLKHFNYHPITYQPAAH